MTCSFHDEISLLRSAVSGDERAFQEIYRRHSPRMAGLVSSLVPDRDAAEDCLQEVWILVLRKSHSFRGDSQLSSWLYRLTRNHAISFLRRQRARAGRELRGPSDVLLEARGAMPETGDPLLRAQLSRFLDRLPAAKREILLLHDVEELTHEEIARRRGIDPGTSRSQVHKARRMMRELLASSGRAA